MNSKKEETLSDIIKGILTLQDHSDEDLKDLIKITLWGALLIHGLIFALVYWGDYSFGIFNQYDIYVAVKSFKEFFNHGSFSSLNLELLFLYFALSPAYYCIFYKVNAKIKGVNLNIQRKLGQTVRWSLVILIFACTPYSVKAKLYMRAHPIPIIADIFSSSEKFNDIAVETDVNLDKLMEDAIEVTYDELARYPEKYRNIPLRLKGEVDQVIDGDIRVAITQGTYGWSDDVYVTLKGEAKDARLLQRDIVYIFGIGADTITYRGLYGQEVTRPYVKAYGISRTGFSNIASPSGASIEEVAIRSIYGNYDGRVRDDSENGKLITGAAWTVTGAQGDLKGWNGANLVVVPNVTKYFTENGIKKALVLTNTVINENGVKATCHTCGSIVGAIILKLQDGKWKEISNQRILTIDGSWGDPPNIIVDINDNLITLHIEGGLMQAGFSESWKYDITFKNGLWKTGEVKRNENSQSQYDFYSKVHIKGTLVLKKNGFNLEKEAENKPYYALQLDSPITVFGKKTDEFHPEEVKNVRLLHIKGLKDSSLDSNVGKRVTLIGKFESRETAYDQTPVVIEAEDIRF